MIDLIDHARVAPAYRCAVISTNSFPLQQFDARNDCRIE